MLKYVTVAFALILAILDFLAYKRLEHYNAKSYIKRIFAVLTKNKLRKMPSACFAF